MLRPNGDGTYTLNLTIPFTVWLVVFVGLGIITDSMTLVVIGLIPVFFMLTFFGLALFTFFVGYLNGRAVRLTNHRTGRSKVYQRSRRR